LKPLRYPTKSDEHAYMKMRKQQNVATSGKSRAENWFLNQHLEPIKIFPGLKFSRQAVWGYRIFDFWFAEKGVCIEVEGPEHNAGYDQYRDQYNFLLSGIVVLRVKNFNEDDAEIATTKLLLECSWAKRREAMGLLTKKASMKGRRVLALNGDWQEALRLIDKAGLYCSYGKPTGPSIQPTLF
jgi:very-short-patch-repair endonuclease